MKKLISIILCLSLAVAALFTLVACSNIADNTKYYTKVTATLKLSKSYEGKSFLDNGIGKATVDAFTDGDTTRFKLEQGDIIIVRYYQIDTPESTGSVEKWGRAASNYVKERLSQATEIVLEATKDKAEKDSYGTRYLGYVWYKTAKHDFRNLNLEMVENGFSQNKGDNTEDYPYNSYFKKANDFARSIQLRIYSKLDDPLYSTDPVITTIKEFRNNTDLFYSEDTNSGAKIQFTAYLSDLTISTSDTYTFTAVQYEPETGKTYTLNVYAGYSSSSISRLKIGHLYTIIGNVQKHNNAFQVSGLTYNEDLELENATTIAQRNYYLKFSSSETYILQLSSILYTDVTVTEVAAVEDGTITFKGTAYKRYDDGVIDEEASTFTFTVKVPENYNNQIAVGTKLSLAGLQLEKNSGEITILNYNNISIK